MRKRRIFDTKPVEYLIAFLVTGFTAAICFPFAKTIGYQTVGLIFLIIVAVLSLFLGRTAVLFAAVLNFVVWNYFFIPPIFTFHVHSYHDVITLFANLVIAIVSGALITRIKKNQADLKKSQERISILNSFLESLNNANSIKDLARKVQDELKKHFSAEAIIYLKEKDGQGLARKAFGNLELFNDNAYLEAKQIFEKSNLNGDITNRNNTLNGTYYYPLITARTAIGVIGINFNKNSFPDADKQVLLNSFIAQITSALGREISIDVAKEKEVYVESQKLFQTVLNSVSHELRTPIAIISTAISNLNDDKTAANVEIRKQICFELNSASNRLNLLVENILDMSKIESGYLMLNLQDCDVSDLIGISLNELKDDIQKHNINIDIQENLPSIRIDINWFKQVIINILHNAIIYTPPDSEISIKSFSNSEDSFVIDISDNGNGVPEQTLHRLFDKFFRVTGSKSGGTGLGLTIAKAIVEAHGGKITAENRREGGLKISIYLPITNLYKPEL